MSGFKKKIISVLLCFVLLCGVCGCGSQTNSDTYLELVDSPATTLDNVWYNPGGIFRCAVFESLIMTDADMTTLHPALAEDYQVSEDGLTYLFTLRDDVKWHDGERFDAEDVVFSIKAALRSEEINGVIYSAFQYIEGAEAYSTGASEELTGLTVEGETVRVQLVSPVGGFYSAVAQFAILPEHLLGDVEPNEIPLNDYWKNPIGCGCYKVTEAVEGEYFILEVNKDYYGKKPGISRIRLRLNEEDCVQAMKDGTLDFYITNDPEEIAELKGIKACSEHDLNILFPVYLFMNLSDDKDANPQLQDVRVREALLLAIDRDTIVDAIFPGSSVSDTLVPSWDSWYWDESYKYEFNPKQAKQLLDEAGFDYSQTIRLRYSVKGQSSDDLMEAIAVYWRAIGVKVDVERFEGSGSEHMFNVRDYDVCYKRLSAFNHASIYEEVHGDGVMQTKVLGQPVYDEYVEELVVTMDEEKRKEIVQSMQELDQQYLLRMPLFALANVAYVNDTHLQIPDVYGNLWYRYNLQFEDWKLMR